MPGAASARYLSKTWPPREVTNSNWWGGVRKKSRGCSPPPTEGCRKIPDHHRTLLSLLLSSTSVVLVCRLLFQFFPEVNTQNKRTVRCGTECTQYVLQNIRYHRKCLSNKCNERASTFMTSSKTHFRKESKDLKRPAINQMRSHLILNAV